MSDWRLLDHILRCPLSGQPLQRSKDELISEQGAYSYPLFGDVPWLLANPRFSIADWQIKISHLYEHLVAESKQLGVQSQSAQGRTRERLVTLARAKQAYARQLVEITNLLLQEAPDQGLLQATLPDQAPRTQNLLSYSANLYRDWVWGAEENNAALQSVVDVLPKKMLSQKVVSNLLVPGCGAGRLLYDLHHHLSPALSVGTDINPLFVFAAQRLFQGQSLSLVEFPGEPIDHASVAVEQVLRGVDRPSDNLFVLFADVLSPAFKPAVFDLIITPWLIDILPMPLEITLRALNHYLPEGGYWVNYGSLVFHQGDTALHYSVEEVVELAKPLGFDIEVCESRVQPYLKSPLNAGYRMEQVWVWRAVKTKSVELSKTTQHMPEWLLDTSLPVPASDLFAQLAQQNSVSGEALSWANGQTSLRKMSSRLSKRYNVSKPIAEKSLIQLYREAYEQSRSRFYSSGY